MKHLMSGLVILLATQLAWATGGFEPQDRWPWKWGAECPFPWKSVDGDWTVKSLVETGQYHGHRLEIKVEDDTKPGVKLLMVVQYDEEGSLVATGEGYSENDGKVITAYMSPIAPGGKTYRVIVRSYDKRADSINSRTRCASRNRILAATFCSIRGRKCMQDSNYILE